MKGFAKIDLIQSTLLEVLEDVDCQPLQWFQQAERIAATVHCDPAVLRTCERQKQRKNHPSKDPSKGGVISIHRPF